MPPNIKKTNHSKAMKKIFSLIGIFLFCFYFQLTIHAESKNLSTPSSEGILIIRGSNDFFPFEYLNERGEPEGFNIDLIKAIMKKLNRHYQLRLEPIEKVLREFKYGQVDIITGLTNSPFWGNDFLFANPHYAVSLDIISRKKDEHYKSTHDLIGKDVIVCENGWGYSYLLSQKGIKRIITVNNLSKAMSLLNGGKYDAILCSESASLAVEREGYENLIIQKTQSASQGYCIVIHKHNLQLQKQINNALRELRYDGTYNRIFHNWFQDKEKKNLSGSVLLAILTLCASSAIAILFSLLLRYRIKTVTRLLEKTNRQMKLAIAAGGIDLWTYNIEEERFYYIYGKDKKSYNNDWDSYDKNDNQPYKNEKTGITTFAESIKKLHPDFLEKYKSEFNAIINGDKRNSTFVVQMQNVDNSPQYNYLEFTISGIKNKIGEIVGIRGLQRNITEEQRQKVEIEQKITLLNSIYKNLPIGLCVYNKEGKMIVINEACLSIFGIPDKSIVLESNLHNEPNIPQKHKEQLFKGEDVSYIIEYDFDLMANSSVRRFKKGIVHIEAKAAVLHASNGSIDGYLFIYNDITSSIETQQHLKTAKEEAERSNKLKSAFLANMSHEIRTPLNAIVGFSELLTSADDQKEREEFYKIIATNNELLLKLINDILDLSKIEAGYLELKNSPFEINAMFKEISFSLKQRIKEDVELRTSLPCESCWVNLDRNRLIQIITNFGTNAIKYTHQGNITLGYKLIDDGLNLYVSDTGAGISDENQAKVFDLFEKLNDFVQGTGLGLSICKSIAESYDGKVGVSSTPSKGSLFWCWIPCKPEKNLSQGALLQNETYMIEEPTTNEQEASRTKNILIVEDNPSNDLLLTSMIKGNYLLWHATNGREAVDFVRSQVFDLIFMDLNMPLMDGFEATQRIREFNLETPIIAVTANAFENDKFKALEIGCSDLIIKPIHKESLQSILQKYLPS